MVQFLTNIPETGFSLGYLPKLPTLMPCPGPHVTPVTCSSSVPSPTEIQSSPVPIFESIMCSHGKMLEGEVLAL
uniref:Uncharacterized protein n=1 Tax=Salix viminalis TaxID=40686 RepID=A0A6N2MID2_SALVM